jgi:hypothetical protein
MNQLQNLTRGRKRATSLVSKDLAESWEAQRITRQIPVTFLPVSAPTYRKVILTGVCDRLVFIKLSNFFQGGEK